MPYEFTEIRLEKDECDNLVFMNTPQQVSTVRKNNAGFVVAFSSE